MSMPQSRRDFIRTTALAGVGLWAGAEAQAEFHPKSPNDKLNFACIGVGGKGDSDTDDAGRFGNVVALCDTDDDMLNKKALKFPNAKKYNDYRKMFDEMGKSIDGVTVSIPDHSHCSATSIALHMGKAAYTQKPLAHSVFECRHLGTLARKMKVATQMGNQGTADNSMRANAYRVRAGALGTVSEVHVWTNRPIWPQGMERPTAGTAPSNLHWDLWLGPAADRPYGDGYQPFVWRGYWDFGTGALGDMACHTVNLPYMALDLKNPVAVTAKSSGTNFYTYPHSSEIVYEFAATNARPALKMIWYDGGNLPPRDLIPSSILASTATMPSSGSLIVGDKGKLYTPGDYGGGGRMIDGSPADVPFPESPGHWEEFVRAIRGGQPATSNFPDYASGLAETILLGNLAVWVAGERVEWDARNMRVKNGSTVADKVAHIIRPTYRSGYSL